MSDDLKTNRASESEDVPGLQSQHEKEDACLKLRCYANECAQLQQHECIPVKTLFFN